MLTYIKTQLSAPWDVMRLIRVVLGAALAMQAWQAGDAWLGLLGIFFAGQGLMNVGCCGTAACYTPVNKNAPAAIEDAEYTEIK